MIMRKRDAAALLLVAATVACTLSCAGIPTDIAGRSERHEVEVVGNLRYADDGLLDISSKHWLDVYRPKDADHAPVLIFIHGGAWRLGDKSLHPNVGQTFAQRGIVTVSVNYALAPFGKHPDQVHDAARAFEWVKKNIAKYGGDPDDVFLSGHSAGGHLAALLVLNDKYLKERGYSQKDVRGLIGLSGLYRVAGTGPVFVGIFDNNEETIRDASPVMHVDDHQPPVLLFTAQLDIAGLDGLAVEFDEALRQHHSPVKFVRVPNRTHESEIYLIGTDGDPVTAEMTAFIRANSRAAK